MFNLCLIIHYRSKFAAFCFSAILKGHGVNIKDIKDFHKKRKEKLVTYTSAKSKKKIGVNILQVPKSHTFFEFVYNTPNLCRGVQSL